MWRASTSSIMAASSGAEPMASASDVRSPSALPERRRRRPTAALVEGRQDLDGLAVGRGWSARSAAPKRMSAAGAPRVEAELGEQVAVAVVVGELGGDVRARSTSTIRWPAGRRAEHGQVPAAALLELEVEPRPAAAERADQLADQALALDAPDPGDDRQAGVEIEGEGVLAGLDHQSFHAHDGWIGARREARPEPNDPVQMGRTDRTAECGGDAGCGGGVRGQRLRRSPRPDGRLRRTRPAGVARRGARVLGGTRRRRASTAALASPQCAPLAQSAEHFHGKEEVVGSIPTGGSVRGRTEAA